MTGELGELLKKHISRNEFKIAENNDDVSATNKVTLSSNCEQTIKYF